MGRPNTVSESCRSTLRFFVPFVKADFEKTACVLKTFVVSFFKRLKVPVSVNVNVVTTESSPAFVKIIDLFDAVAVTSIVLELRASSDNSSKN